LNPWGKRGRGRLISTWKEEIRDSMQRRNFRDEECFHRELWEEKKYMFALKKNVSSQKNSFYNNNNNNNNNSIQLFIIIQFNSFIYVLANSK
jgi:hypothetical protein